MGIVAIICGGDGLLNVMEAASTRWSRDRRKIRVGVMVGWCLQKEIKDWMEVLHVDGMVCMAMVHYCINLYICPNLSLR